MDKSCIANFTSVQGNIQIELLRELKRAFVWMVQVWEVFIVKMLLPRCDIDAYYGALLSC